MKRTFAFSLVFLLLLAECVRHSRGERGSSRFSLFGSVLDSVVGETHRLMRSFEGEDLSSEENIMGAEVNHKTHLKNRLRRRLNDREVAPHKKEIHKVVSQSSSRGACRCEYPKENMYPSCRRMSSSVKKPGPAKRLKTPGRKKKRRNGKRRAPRHHKSSTRPNNLVNLSKYHKDEYGLLIIPSCHPSCEAATFLCLDEGRPANATDWTCPQIELGLVPVEQKSTASVGGSRMNIKGKARQSKGWRRGQRTQEENAIIMVPVEYCPAVKEETGPGLPSPSPPDLALEVGQPNSAPTSSRAPTPAPTAQPTTAPTTPAPTDGFDPASLSVSAPFAPSGVPTPARTPQPTTGLPTPVQTDGFEPTMPSFAPSGLPTPTRTSQPTTGLTTPAPVAGGEPPSALIPDLGLSIGQPEPTMVPSEAATLILTAQSSNDEINPSATAVVTPAPTNVSTSSPTAEPETTTVARTCTGINGDAVPLGHNCDDEGLTVCCELERLPGFFTCRPCGLDGGCQMNLVYDSNCCASRCSEGRCCNQIGPKVDLCTDRAIGESCPVPEPSLALTEAATPEPAEKPTPATEEVPPSLYETECSELNKCDMCVGDCDGDDDCEDGLVCFSRDGNETVPFCTGGGVFDSEGTDYCTLPDGSDAPAVPPPLFDVECSTHNKCDMCTGDCDDNEDCADGLVCFKRDAYEAVPSCSQGGDFDFEGTDYCVIPN